LSITVSGLGPSAAFETEEWNATRLAKIRAALRRMRDRSESFFMGIVLHLYSYPAALQTR
jgi:hypothetical protein